TITTSFLHPKQHHSGGKNGFRFSCMFLIAIKLALVSRLSECRFDRCPSAQLIAPSELVWLGLLLGSCNDSQSKSNYLVVSRETSRKDLPIGRLMIDNFLGSLFNSYENEEANSNPGCNRFETVRLTFPSGPEETIFERSSFF
ncbi:unnamed protein product, partial [Nesidiocoris tenuis]